MTLVCLRQLGLPPSCGPVNQLFIGVFKIRLLCWAAMSPGDPQAYPAAQGACKAVHSFAHSSPQLLFGGQTLDIATVPHDPARQGQQHQKGPCVHQQIPKVAALDLEWSKDPQ